MADFWDWLKDNFPNPGKEPSDDKEPDSNPSTDEKEQPAAVKPPSPAQSWIDGIERLRKSVKTTVGWFAAIIALALGTGPLFFFDELSSSKQAAWVAYGVSAAVTGVLLVIWYSSKIELPEDANYASLISADDLVPVIDKSDLPKAEKEALKAAVQSDKLDLGSEVERLKSRIQTVIKRLYAAVVGGVGLDPQTQPDSIIEVVQFARGVEIEARDAEDGSLDPERPEAERKLLGDRAKLLNERLESQQRQLSVWRAQIAFAELRSRYDRIKPPMFMAAAFTVVGLIIYLAAAQVNPSAAEASEETPTQETETESMAEATPMLGTVTITDPVLATEFSNALGIGCWSPANQSQCSSIQAPEPRPNPGGSRFSPARQSRVPLHVLGRTPI